MKKLSYSIKPLGLICLLLFSISLIITSCKKTTGNNPESFNLSDLQNWEAKNFNHKALLFNSLKPDWNKVFINNQENESVYEVDVINKENVFLSLGFANPSSVDSLAAKSKIKMLFFKDNETGKIINGYYMVSISDEKPHYKKYGSYTGAVYYYGANGNLINGYIYQGGKATQSIKGANAEAYKASLNERTTLGMRGIGRGKLQLAEAQNCYTDVSPVYGMSCVTVETYTDCTPYVKGYNYTTVCTDIPTVGDGDGGGVGGGGSGGSGGGSGSGGGTAPTLPEVSDEVPDSEPSESDYAYTCPDNFDFAGVTLHELWQEAELTDIYCNLGIYDFMTGTVNNEKYVQIPQVYFGLPYFNVEGKLIYTRNEAKAIAADAINSAEVDMRKKYKANPYLSSGQLAEYWVKRIDIRMKEYTKGLGKAGKTGSTNTTQTPPKKKYAPC
ncbi:hypothetical protein OC25_00305 [Pedobacter kyungheensis]|uniref:Lipoprotein n=1 Tax=Pedobacter kyungheensis TaxID=1069985 RepID=A0A0C1FV81_9SPHI|nr:hypothetical protein [Pedobacter kyungheensis]KIA96892.1 hypothetical protein OC25_00305 [Pedobacter kyungheensis]